MLLIQGDFGVDGGEQSIAGIIDRFVDMHVRPGEAIGLVEAIPPDDMRHVARLADELPNVRRYPFQWIWTHGLPAHAGQIWLTTRFHPHLLAAAAGASGTIVGVHDGYYDIKHESLLRLGTGWQYAHSGLGPVDVELAPSSNPAFPVYAAAYSREKIRVADGLYPVTTSRRNLRITLLRRPGRRSSG
jgi:hypothetical protein